MAILEKLVDWFLNSQIYNGEAYLAYYSAKRKGPVYPEITAYAISLSRILYQRRKDKIFLERAEKCAEYMMKINKNGAVPSFADGLLYTFDTGIFISSMFDLYVINKKEIYLREAEKSLKWLYSKRNGEQIAAVNKIPAKKKWYHISSVHLAKLAIPLLKASVYFGNPEYEKTAFKLLDEYKRLQLKDGNFQVNDENPTTMIHPHCYATEAFLYAYYYSKRDEYFEIVKKASDWLSKIQNEDGSLYRTYPVEKRVIEQLKKFEKVKTADATAQATRIWKLLGANKEGIEKAYKYLNSELKDNGLRLLKKVSLRGKLFSWRRAVYSWPTFFFIHSLILPYGEIEYCNELF